MEKQETQATATGGEKVDLLKQERDQCSIAISEALTKYNCYLTASITIDNSGNYPNIIIANKPEKQDAD